jgi:hypothetical protein
VVVASVHVISSPEKQCWTYLSSTVINFQVTESIFTGSRTQASFYFIFDLSSCNLLAEANSFGLCVILLSSVVSELQKPFSPGLESRTIFWVAFVHVISSQKQTTSALVLFFYQA